MSKFIRNIEVTKEFEGDTVKVVLQPMTTTDALDIEEKDTKALITLVQKYILHFSGLRDAAGVDLTKEDVFASAYFMGLLADLAEEWADRSIPDSLKSRPSVK